MPQQSLFVGLFVGLFGGLGMGLSGGLSGGLVGVLDQGGWYLLLQRSARRKAQDQNLLPRDLTEFVHKMASVGVLRLTGGGVQFRHRELLEFLAKEAPPETLADIRRLTVKPTSEKGERPIDSAAGTPTAPPTDHDS